MLGRKGFRCLMEDAHLKTYWIRYEISRKDGYVPYSPYSPPLLPPETHREPTAPSSSGTRISPAVLFVIVILAVLFFISGLLHLLVRFLIKHPSSRSPPELSTSDALQRQLQQLFHIHDSGLDQAFIDALPVFVYKEIVGGVAKQQFDCAVCLSEFTENDKLRLLPSCSHAFHISCIDTWLLSNSTCPLCRNTLYTPGFSMENPIFDFDEDDECRETRHASVPKAMEIEEETVVVENEKGVLPVRLGKFRRIDNNNNFEREGEGVGETSSSNMDARRCFSMGSYQYVVGESELRVALTHRRRELVKPKPECVENEKSCVDEDVDLKKISSIAKGESFSVSKIWQWSKKGKFSSLAETETMTTGMPSSLRMDLPWMSRTQEK